MKFTKNSILVLILVVLSVTGCAEKKDGMLLGSWSCQSIDSEGNQGDAIQTYASDGSGSGIATIHTKQDLDRDGVLEKIELNLTFKGTWKLVGADLLEENMKEVRIIGAFVNNNEIDTRAANEWFKPVLDHMLASTQSSTIVSITDQKMIIRNSGLQFTCLK